MMMPLRKNFPLIKIINNVLIDLHSPSNISTIWKFGSFSNLLNNPNSHSAFSCYTLLSWYQLWF